MTIFERLRTKYALTRVEAQVCLEKVVGAVYDGLKEDGRVAIKDFGIFTAKRKAATKAGKRIMLGKLMNIKAKPATTVLKFRPAKDMKARVAKFK